MRYINQLEYPHWLYVTKTDMDEAAKESGKTTTIATSGCGLCAAVMAVDRLLPNCTFDLMAAMQLAYEVHANHSLGTDLKRFAPALAQKLHLQLEMTGDPDALTRCLAEGGAAVVHVGGDREGYVGVFSDVGHYVTAIAVEADGRIAILDPAYRDGRFAVPGRKGKVEVKYAPIALCDVSVLVQDSANRTPSFYLFRRA